MQIIFARYMLAIFDIKQRCDDFPMNIGLALAAVMAMPGVMCASQEGDGPRSWQSAPSSAEPVPMPGPEARPESMRVAEPAAPCGSGDGVSEPEGGTEPGDSEFRGLCKTIEEGLRLIAVRWRPFYGGWRGLGSGPVLPRWKRCYFI